MSNFDRQSLKKTPRLALRVTEHAAARFRERVEEEFLHRSDDDLADLLNERVRAAVLVRDVVDPREPGMPTTLYLFESRTGARLVAVAREKCVVTVLDDWMARSNYPGWEDGTTPPSSHLGSPLADKIRALAIIPAQAPQKMAAPDPVAAASAPVTTAPDASQIRPDAASITRSDAALARPDAYASLAAECRVLGQRLRALRDRRGAIDAEIDAAMKEYEEKRVRLIAIMDEGAPS